MSAFIKFFREKYRLCWKEIYLKIHAIVYEAEQCKNCREYFQIANIASCSKVTEPCEYKLEGPNLSQNFKAAGFHEIDHSEKEIKMLNDFTKRQIQIFKQEVQVIDN